MKGNRLILSLWLSTALFCLLQIALGPGGISETARLEAYRTALAQRLEGLDADGRRLAARYEALKSSVEEIRLEARNLGWFRPGEIPLRTLDGAVLRAPSEEPNLTALEPYNPEPTIPNLFFRLAWPLIFAVIWASFLLVDRWKPPVVGAGLSRALLPAGVRDRLPMVWSAGLDLFRK